MSDSITISTRGISSQRRNGSIILAILISVLIGTALRISLLLIYPVIVLLAASFYKFRLSSSFIIVLSLAVVSFVLSLFDNLFLTYKAMSLYYMVPFLLLLFFNPAVERDEN